MEKKNIVVFASGNGTTFRALLEHSLTESSSFSVLALVSDRKDCGACKIATEFSIPVIDYNADIVNILQGMNFHLIVLAGFLKILNTDLVHLYNNHIINIHPSLLPAFGGKNFYGTRVHRAVIASGTMYSGFTVHLVNEGIDSGPVIFQNTVPVLSTDTAEDLQMRVHGEELEYFPDVIDSLCRWSYEVKGNRVIMGVFHE